LKTPLLVNDTDQISALGGLDGDCPHGGDNLAAGGPAWPEPGIRPFPARDKRIRARPLWLGALPDVPRLGNKHLGLGVGDSLAGEDEGGQGRPGAAARGRAGARRWARRSTSGTRSGAASPGCSALSAFRLRRWSESAWAAPRHGCGQEAAPLGCPPILRERCPAGDKQLGQICGFRVEHTIQNELEVS
jgi:hypothetical protein